MLTNTAEAPMMNAIMSVTDVIVMATPPFFNMKAIRSSTVDSERGGAPAIPDSRINISSIPMPRRQNQTMLYFLNYLIRKFIEKYKCLIYLL